MIICPRCQQPVDETVRATCPLCFTPIPQPQPASPAQPPNTGIQMPLNGMPLPPQPVPVGNPPPNELPAMPGQMPSAVSPPPRPAAFNPGARVSLTGEVIDDGMPAGPAPSYVGGAVPAPPPRLRTPNATARTPANRLRPEVSTPEKTGGGNAVGIIAALVILLGGGFGGWYWWMHRTNPKDQAAAVYKSFVNENWESVYPLVLLSEEDKKKYPDAGTFSSAFAQQSKTTNDFIKRLPNGEKMVQDMKSSAKVGEPVITGDKADVPTTAAINTPLGTINVEGKAHMVNDGGIWKLDLSSGSSQALRDLIGKPNLPGGLSGFKGL